MGILFTNRKLPSFHSESVPRSGSKASIYSYAEKSSFTTQPRLLTTPLGKKTQENIEGKGENAGNLLYKREKSSFWQHLLSRLQMFSISSSPKFCRLVKS